LIIGTLIVVVVLLRRLFRAMAAHDKAVDAGVGPIGAAEAGVAALVDDES
jgi:hypothetical protein